MCCVSFSLRVICYLGLDTDRFMIVPVSSDRERRGRMSSVSVWILRSILCLRFLMIWTNAFSSEDLSSRAYQPTPRPLMDSVFSDLD